MDAQDGQTQETDRRITQDETDAGDGQTQEIDRRRRQHKEGKGLRRVRGKDEGTNQRVGGGEAKRRD